MTIKRLQQSHWTPVNMTEDVIKLYENFNTKGCPEELIFGDFNNKPIPYTYSDFINDYDDGGTKIDSALADNKRVEDTVGPNYEDTNEKMTADDDDSLA